MLFLGIDPGQRGGWGLVDAAGGFVAADHWRDGITTLRTLAPYAPRVALCHLERVSLFPRQTKGFLVQMQSLLTSAGRWFQILEFLRIPYQLIHPQTWQAAYDLYHWQCRRAKLGKPASGYDLTPWDLAARLWPESGIKGQGQSGPAVGLLLAEHARRCGQGC